jgi:hypothetical protein
MGEASWVKGANRAQHGHIQASTWRYDVGRHGVMSCGRGRSRVEKVAHLGSLFNTFARNSLSVA